MIHLCLSVCIVVDFSVLPLWDYLAARWLAHSPGAQTRIMWDLALIIALDQPKLATEGVFKPPPENTQRDIFVYTGIHEEAMIADWWKVVDETG